MNLTNEILDLYKNIDNKLIIIKRDGREEPFQLMKMYKVITWATQDQDTLTYILLKDLRMKIEENAKIKNIYDHLIHIAASKISAIGHAWDEVAKRLLLLKIYKEEFNLKRTGNYYSFNKFLTEGVKYGIYDEKIVNLFDEDEIDELGSYIDPNRDLIFNYKGLSLFVSKYCKEKYVEKKKRKLELPQITYMVAAMDAFAFEPANTREEKKRRLKLIQTEYDNLSLHRITYSTPRISFGMGTNRQMASCVLIHVGDSIEAINWADMVAGVYSSFAGGISMCYNDVRSRGSIISSNKGKSDGPIPFIKRNEQTVSSFNQRGCLARGSYVDVIDYVELTTGEKLQFRKELVSRELWINKDLGDFINEKAIDLTLSNGYTITKAEMVEIWKKRLLNYPRQQILNEHPNISITHYKRHLCQYLFNVDASTLKGFKTISGFPTHLIHPDGTVVERSLKYISKQNLNFKGYVVVFVNDSHCALHRLMYSTFIGPIPKDYTVDHIDGNKQNNSVENLQLMTSVENARKWQMELESKDPEVFKSHYRKLRVKRHLNYCARLNGYRTGDNTEIKRIVTKTIPIERVHVRDYIKCYNTESQAVEFKKVDATHEFSIPVERQYELIFENGTKIVTSDHHPIFYRTPDGKIAHKRTDEMNVGDLCITENNTNTTLVAVNRPVKPLDFYDLTVYGNNNYFACSMDSVTGEKSEKILVHNTRKGSVSIYFQWWNNDVMDLLVLKDEGGAEDMRARKCKYGFVINRIFLERVKNDDYITLFDPKEVPDLSWLSGDEFEKRYLEYEKNSGSLTTKTIKAREVMFELLRVRTETGNIYIFFSDNVNEQNVTNRFVTMSNLCAEITVPARPPKSVKETYITTENGTKQVISTREGAEIGLCNLSSINAYIFDSLEDHQKDKLVNTLLRGMDNVLDNQFYPVKEGEIPNRSYRPIGIGVNDIANLLASKGLKYSDPASYQVMNNVMDDLYYRIYRESVELAKERGPYEGFKQSNWAKGLTPFHLSIFRRNNPLGLKYNTEKWDDLAEEIKKYGVRFSLHGAQAPTACIWVQSNILTLNGPKTMEKFLLEDCGITKEEKDEIVTRNVPTWITLKKPVIIPTRHGHKEIRKVYYNGMQYTRTIELQSGEKISFTYNHPVWTMNGWKKVGNLHISDTILNKNDQWEPIVSLVNETELRETWDIEVPDVHEYYTAECGLVTHNTSGKVTNALEAAEPILDLFYLEVGTHTLPTIVKGIPSGFAQHYERAYDIDPKVLLNHAAIRQTYLDQSQSFNLYYKDVSSVSALTDDMIYAYNLGIKTLYYLKSLKAGDNEECASCSA